MNKTISSVPENVVKDTRAFKLEVNKLAAGEVAAAEAKPIFAAMGIYEQRESGTYMVRVRGTAGIFLPNQARHIAKLSEAYGSGIIHVTTRQDLQIHRVLLPDLPTVLESLLEVGLACRGGGGDTVRNVAACPRAGVCPDEEFDITPYANALSDYLLRDKGSFYLPRKFKVSFSGCDEDCALCCVTDLGLFAHIRNGIKGFSVYAGGGMGKNSALAIPIDDFIPAEGVFEVAEALKRIFNKHGDRTNRSKARLRFVVERMGADEFRRLYRKELEQVRKEELATPEICLQENEVSKLAPSSIDEPADSAYLAWKEANINAQKQAGLSTVRIPLHLGDINASELAAVAGIAEEFGDKTLRATQEQDLQVRGVPASKLPALYGALKKLHVRLAAGPSIRCVSCTGASTCKMGLRQSRGLARAIEQELSGIEPRLDSPIRISGCPNSCGHHPIASLGLYGGAATVNGKPVPYYTIVAGGRSGENNRALAEMVAKVPARAVPALLKEFFSGASVDNKMDRNSIESLRELAVKYERVPPYEESPEYYSDFGP